MIQTRVFFIAVFSLLLAGCASSRLDLTNRGTNQEWVKVVINYEATLPATHPDRIENLLRIDPDIVSQIRDRFTQSSKHVRARQLALWLINPKGLYLKYNNDANFGPNDTFRNREGNCLSFTLLLTALAEQIDVKLEYNEVDYPGMWDFDSTTGIIFYRHINAKLDTLSHSQIFDLAIENYREGYPQRIISKRDAGALLLNNLGVEAMRSQNYASSLHYLMLGISTNPINSDLWVNLGVLMKKQSEFKLAETAFLKAIELDPKHGIAASNLNHLYNQTGDSKGAAYFKKLAFRSRMENPYFLYQNAKNFLENSEFSKARRTINRAIRLHKTEAMFFELRSSIYEQKENYYWALKDMIQAYSLTKIVRDRRQYQAKAEELAQRLKDQKAYRRR